MKELHMEKFDALLSLASAECVKEEAEAFLSADISEIGDNPQMLRKVLGGSRKGKWHTVKIILLVALLCMSIAFTACMLVPEIRQAIWNVLVRGHDDHVEINFEENSEKNSITPVAEYPNTIEKKMELTYVPEGYAINDERLSPIQYSIGYSNSKGEWKFTISQSVIDIIDSFVNEYEGKISSIEIDGFDAILIECNEGSFSHKLIWQDDHYRYIVCGYFPSTNEIIKIAEGVI
ncbi:MAG: DUF4367 domain-containing protein [Clostridia bacterium]|nr:DUF4367 domain-containing protein [Clostridia bacterium]